MSEDWKGASILIVDDTPKVVSALESLYGQLGLDVVGHAVNGLDALSKVKELKPDLVSMDIIMPEMDGVECFRRLRDNEEFASKRPKVFFVTYLATEPKIIEAYRDEIPEYLFLAKTYSMDSAKQVLNRLYNLKAVLPEANSTSQNAPGDGPTVV